MLGPESRFVLVTGPEPESVRHAQDFFGRLEGFEVPLEGLIANRVRQWPRGSAFAGASELSRAELEQVFRERGESPDSAAASARATLEMLASNVHWASKPALELDMSGRELGAEQIRELRVWSSAPCRKVS